MNKKHPMFHLALVIGLMFVLIVLAGCSAAGIPEAAAEVPAPEVQALEIQPAAGGGASQPTNAAAPEARAESEQPLAALAQTRVEAPEPEADLQSETDAPTAEEQVESPVEAAVESQPEEKAVDSGPLPPVDPTIGNLAPDFSLGTLAGQSMTLEDLRGRAVVLNYWVTWCVPCRDEMPDIEALYQEYQDEGLVVLSVNGTKQDTMADIEQFLGDVPVSFPVLLDHSEEVYNSYRILFMPTTFFIDQRGVIQDIVLGSTDAEGFRTRVEQLVSSLN